MKSISRMVKIREFKVKREVGYLPVLSLLILLQPSHLYSPEYTCVYLKVLDSFLSLKIKEVDYDGDLVKQDGKTRKEMMKKMSRRERKVWAVFNQFLKRKKTFRIYLKISVMFLFLVFNISVTVVHVCVMFLIKF